jgi:mono/diheme cytochrome c family protein
MQDIIRVSTSHLTDSDRAAIAAYLKSLPAAADRPAEKPDRASMQLGEAVFAQRCSVCHAADTHDYPSLAYNSVVGQPDPTTLVRVILQGSQTVPVAGKPTGFSMPAFPTLSDAELAAVATYVRTSWGNSAGTVSKGRAAQIRKLLRPD